MAGVAYDVAIVQPFKTSLNLLVGLIGTAQALGVVNDDPDLRIVNMSFQVTNQKAQQALQDEINAAFNAGKLMFAAAGNAATCDGLNDVVFPARDPQVVAVGGTNWHDERAGQSYYGEEIEVAAPGQRIVGAGNPDLPDMPGLCAEEHCYWTGTSQATAIASGVAALVWSADLLGLSADDVRHIMKSSCDVLDHQGEPWDGLFGCGRVNALRALSRAKGGVVNGAPCAADVDGDCVVAVLDLVQLIGEWGPCGECCYADINFDRDVDVLDLLDLLLFMGSVRGWLPSPGEPAGGDRGRRAPVSRRLGSVLEQRRRPELPMLDGTLPER